MIVVNFVGMLQRYATRYYEHLLTAEPLSQQVLECRNQIWSHINEIVSPEMNRQLVVPFSSEELRTAL